MSSAYQPSRSGRAAIYLSLVLAVALVLGVVIGAKVVFDRAAKQPVPMSDLPAPLADSPECAALLDTLPGELIGHERAEILEPAPQGAAAWASSSTERVTLRCGVDLPLQYTAYAPTETIDGVEWLRITDATPGSTLQTWYAVDRAQVVAVTADSEALGREDEPVSALSGSVSTLADGDHDPFPAPLSRLSDGDTAVCGDLLAALPDTVAEMYERVDVPEAHTVAWVADGREPIVLRCGVAPPENYEPGIQLNQVNDIVWFEDTVLASGTTAATWFALGRETDIAVSTPQDVSSEVLVQLGDVIAAETAEQ